jgi:hypothetical protein
MFKIKIENKVKTLDGNQSFKNKYTAENADAYDLIDGFLHLLKGCGFDQKTIEDSIVDISENIKRKDDD